MELTNKEGVRLIVNALAELGLRHVVICPGSRNAPFVISFNRHAAFKCYSIRDERSAGFFALGLAKETHLPVAILCTSGSATVNFAPAITEAYYQRIPLVVLTTDRPEIWVDQGDGQTIRQQGIYNNYIRKSYVLKGDAEKADEFWYNTRCLSEGFAIATLSDPGPIHYNIPLHEPLYNMVEALDKKNRIFYQKPIISQLSQENAETMASALSLSKKVMILVGQFSDQDGLLDLLIGINAHPQVVVLTETLSNMYHASFIGCIDRCITGLTDEEIGGLMPDILITIGDAVVSKRIKSALRKFKPIEHWNIHPFDSRTDTYQSLTQAVPLNPAVFFQQINHHVTSNHSGYQGKWKGLDERRRNRHQWFANRCEYSDLYVFGRIFSALKEGSSLHIANSSPVRYAQLFDNSYRVKMHCNRGTSGIEGCTSTAMGSAAASVDKSFIHITGDVAFHYDVNGLWNDNFEGRLKIIVINNGGGGIFRIIEGPNKVQERREFIEAAMATNAEKIAEHFQWKYIRAVDAESLGEALDRFLKEDVEKTILEICTHPDENPLILEQYWKYLNEEKVL